MSERPATPPPQLTSDPNHLDYHPSCTLVGVRIDGEERRDIIWYDRPAGFYRTLGMKMTQTPLMGTIETHWREDESRQQRRARERWEQNHSKRL